MAFDASDLTPHEHFVLDRARAGEIADFTPMSGPGGAKPVVRAGFLRKLVLQADQNWDLAAPGVRIKAARVEGTLDLSHCINVAPLALIACELGEATDISHARIARLSLQSSTLRQLIADHAEIGGELNLAEVKPAGAEGYESFVVRARGARIGGDLTAAGAKLARRIETTDDALALDDAHISGALRLNAGFEAFGRVSLARARIGGVLDLDSAHLLNRSDSGDAHALDGEGAHIGSLRLSGKCKVEGVVRFNGARIAGDVDFTGAMLRNEGAISLNLTNASVEGQVLADGARLGGQILLVGARVAKNLDFRRLEVMPRTIQRNEAHGRAIDATNITVGGAVFFHGANIKGEVLLADARIENSLAFGGGRFIHSGQWAIRAPNVRVGGNLTFRIADNGFAPLGQKTVIEGGAKFDRAQIEGSVAWAALELRGPGPDSAKGGLLSFANARIAGPLQARALTAQDGARIDLLGASCTTLDDDIKTGWGPDGVRIDLDGFSYARLDGPDERAAQRLHWLKRTRIHGGRFAPQPFAELARVYARAGRRGDARRVALAQHDQQTSHAAAGPFTWLLSAAFGLVAGYGFAPLRVIRALTLFLALGVAGVLTMNAQGALVRADGSACNGAIEPTLYAIDVALPVIDLGQESLCAPGRTGRAELPRGVELDGTDWRLFEGAALWKWAHALYAILGAILSALAVLTFSGVMKPRQD